jgi:ferredoxin-NADP reductase
MEEHVVKIINMENITHDVKRLVVSKPNNYKYIPGQATELAINAPGWKNEKRPFTFTSLNDDPHLEFTIKIYPEHKGVTAELGKARQGDEILIHDVWGAISYKGEGVFIAGGAGITPFIAILRQLNKEGKVNNNALIFSNKTTKDIILKNELESILGKNFISKITEGGKHIDKEYLKQNIKNFDQHFYVCGPEPFMKAIQSYLTELGAKSESVVFEK